MGAPQPFPAAWMFVAEAPWVKLEPNPASCWGFCVQDEDFPVRSAALQPVATLSLAQHDMDGLLLGIGEKFFEPLLAACAGVAIAAEGHGHVMGRRAVDPD